jgi:hypothetical protein
MTKRFFKATIGEKVYFRASDSRVYASATVDGRYGGLTISSSAKPGWSPATEIDKVEYNRLVTLKVQELKAAGRDPAHYASPQDSWVWVEAAEGVVS